MSSQNRTAEGMCSASMTWEAGIVSILFMHHKLTSYHVQTSLHGSQGFEQWAEQLL